MHERALQAANLEGEYREYPVGPDEIWDWLDRVKELGLAGFNITMPYKKSAFSWVIGRGKGKLGRLEALDGVIGAINTVVMDGQRPIGYNTDGEGFLKTLTEPPRGLKLAGWHVVLLGAGGAAQAIAITLVLKARIKRLTIWNRHPDRAKELAHLLEQLRQKGHTKASAQAVEDLEVLPIAECQLLVNATPVGMKGHGEQLVDSNKLHGQQVVYDLVYEPRETPLIRTARERGCQVVTGDEMLAGQGAASFEIWTGVKGMLPVMHQALDEHFTSGR